MPSVRASTPRFRRSRNAPMAFGTRSTSKPPSTSTVAGSNSTRRPTEFPDEPIVPTVERDTLVSPSRQPFRDHYWASTTHTGGVHRRAPCRYSAESFQPQSNGRMTPRTSPCTEDNRLEYTLALWLHHRCDHSRSPSPQFSDDPSHGRSALDRLPQLRQTSSTTDLCPGHIPDR